MRFKALPVKIQLLKNQQGGGGGHNVTPPFPQGHIGLKIQAFFDTSKLAKLRYNDVMTT